MQKINIFDKENQITKIYKIVFEDEYKEYEYNLEEKEEKFKNNIEVIELEYLEKENLKTFILNNENKNEFKLRNKEEQNIFKNVYENIYENIYLIISLIEKKIVIRFAILDGKDFKVIKKDILIHKNQNKKETKDKIKYMVSDDLNFVFFDLEKNEKIEKEEGIFNLKLNTEYLILEIRKTKNISFIFGNGTFLKTEYGYTVNIKENNAKRIDLFKLLDLNRKNEIEIIEILENKKIKED